MGKNGVGVAVNYRAIHLLKYFTEKYGYVRDTYPIAELIGDSTISLPFFPSMTDQERSYVVGTLKESIAEVIV
jgi:dTDP-4-amino-4,6-dideoxygalactose transaminase